MSDISNCIVAFYCYPRISGEPKVMFFVINSAKFVLSFGRCGLYKRMPSGRGKWTGGSGGEQPRWGICTMVEKNRKKNGQVYIYIALWDFVSHRIINLKIGLITCIIILIFVFQYFVLWHGILCLPCMQPLWNTTFFDIWNMNTITRVQSNS